MYKTLQAGTTYNSLNCENKSKSEIDRQILHNHQRERVPHDQEVKGVIIVSGHLK